jgi:hypothetical protein
MIGSRARYSPIVILFVLVVALAWTVAGGGSHGLAQSTALIVAIAKMDVGTPPADFDFALTGQGNTGQWRVVADPTATSSRTIEQSDPDRTDYRFPLAIHRRFPPKMSMHLFASRRSREPSTKRAASL